MNDEFSLGNRKNRSNGTNKSFTDEDMEWHVDAGEQSGSNSTSTNYANMAESSYAYSEDETDENAGEFQLDIRRFIAGILQRKWLVLITASLVTCTIFAIILFAMDRQWQASTTLIKRSHQDRLALAERDPFKSQDYNLATLLDTLKLPSSMEKVRDSLGLQTSITTLAQAIEISLGRDSKIINLKVTWADPDIAAQAANIVAATFIDRTRGLMRNDAQTAYNYYFAQLEETRSKASQLSAKVLEFKQSNGISDLDAETKVILEEMSRLQGEYNTKLAETDALKEAKKRLIEAIAEEPEQVITYTIYRSPLKNRLAEYEWELRDALSKYTNENPKVIKLKERIAALKQMIGQNRDEAVPENTYTPNTKLEEMELRLQQITDDIKLHESMADAFKQTITDMEQKLGVIATQDKEFMLLRAQLDGMLNLESQLAQRVEETRLAMQRNEASFDIVERAVSPSDPLPSGRKLLAMVGLFLGISSGLFLALLLELRDPYLRSRRDVIKIIGNDTCLELASNKSGQAGLINIDDPVGQLSNLYRGLVNDIDVVNNNQSRIIAVASIESGTGRSMVTANLALARCIKGQQTLVVDADLRHSRETGVEALLGMNQSSKGLYEYLVDNTELHINKLGAGKPELISAGKVISDSRGLLELARTDLVSISNQAEPGSYRIFDLPPLDGLEPAYEMAGQLGQIILVNRSGQTRRSDLKRCINQLAQRGIEVVASVVLDVPADRMESAKHSIISVDRKEKSIHGVSAHA
jgi:uncharacterized protein involved in exopolysaccharide biosynthesis/Mrp family chromosome partitioning ATPase